MNQNNCPKIGGFLIYETKIGSNYKLACPWVNKKRLDEIRKAIFA